MSTQPVSPASDDAAWERDVRALEEAARVAFLGADLQALDRLWADGYTVNSPLQRVNDKQQLFELLRAGRIRHLTLEPEIEQMSRHGDVVVVMGHDTVTDPPDGARSRRLALDRAPRARGLARARGLNHPTTIRPVIRGCSEQ